MIIKFAEPEDVDQVASLFDSYRQFYKQSSDIEGAKAFLLERLEGQESIILIAESSDNELAGFTQLYPSFSSVSMGPIWILNDLFVHEGHRRKGVAKLLLDAATEFASQEGALGLSLETEDSNEKAIALYEKEGWVLNKDHRFYDMGLRG